MNRPTLEDPVARAASEAIGGPVGAHARPHRWWTPVRVLLAVFTVVFALGLVQKYPCAQTQWSSDSVRYGKMCYSDIPYLYTLRGFAEHRWPYSADDGKYEVMEYPVGISYVAWLVSQGTRLWSHGPSAEERAHVKASDLWGLRGMSGEVNLYFVLTAFALLLAGLGATLFLAGTSPGRPWDAMGFALSPMLLVAGLVNWDLLAVLCTAGALWAWVRGRPLLAGVMVGLGLATKLYPVFLLGAFLVEAARTRRWRPFGVTVAATGAAWLAVNLPAMLTGFHEWTVFWSFNDHRGADLGSLWLVLRDAGFALDAGSINQVSLALFALACGAILWLGLTSVRPPTVAQIGLLVVVAFLLVNKVYSPQYVLWILPLAALARPRWRDLLIWQAGEALYFMAVWFHLGGWLAPSSGSAPVAYDLAILLRVVAELYLVVLVVRDVRDPIGPAQSISTASKAVAV